MLDQRGITDKGRHDAAWDLYPCNLWGYHAHEAYEGDQVDERHRHRFELNNDYREEIEKPGWFFPVFLQMIIG